MKNRGYIIIIVNVLMTVLLIYATTLIRIVISSGQISKKTDLQTSVQNIAEAGIAKALWCLNQSVGTNCGGTFGSAFGGETNAAFGGGVYDTVVTNITATTKELETTAYFPNKTKPVSRIAVRTRASTDTEKISFIYALQSGQGGIHLGEHADVIGSIYSNGDVTASHENDENTNVTGDVYIAGGTALAPDQQNTTYNADFIFGKTNPQIDLAQSFTPSADNILNKVSFYIKRTSGAPGNLSVRIVNDDNNVPGDTVYESSTLNASSVGTNYGWIDIAFSDPPFLYANTKYWIVLDGSTNSTKYYTIGVDAFDDYAGGTMFYSQGYNSYAWNASGKDIEFKTWSGGVDTQAVHIVTLGNIYAHTITNSTAGGNASGYAITGGNIAGNAIAHDISNSTVGGHATTTNITDSTVGRDLWCQTSFATTVGGVKHCPYSVTTPSDPGPTVWPISDSVMQSWKDDATSGGVFNGNKTTNGNASLGPIKINGDLTVGNGNKLTLTGTVYVAGNVHFDNNSEVSLDSSYGSSSGILIADGTITVDQGVIFSGAGVGSYLMLATTMNDIVNIAVDINNGSNTALFYSPYGIIDIKNTATLKEISAFKIVAHENVTIEYESGLANASFTSGPSGGWSELKGYWQVAK
jgi:hypothetical protein